MDWLKTDNVTTNDENTTNVSTHSGRGLPNGVVVSTVASQQDIHALHKMNCNNFGDLTDLT